MNRKCMAWLVLAAVAALVQAAGAAEEGKQNKRKRIAGEVKAVDVASKTITLAVKAQKNQFEDKTLTVADNVKVRIDGQDKSLADVQVGARASVRLSEDEKTAVAINIGGKKKKPEKT